jgi:hypothetical protein
MEYAQHTHFNRFSITTLASISNTQERMRVNKKAFILTTSLAAQGTVKKGKVSLDDGESVADAIPWASEERQLIRVHPGDGGRLLRWVNPSLWPD